MFLDDALFRPAAMMTLIGATTISVAITDPEAAGLREAVYAWITPAGDPLRIGTSREAVGGRLLQYPRYINGSLAGKKTGTPRWEADLWLYHVGANAELLAVLHQPPAIASVAGPLRPYLDLERELLRAFQPPLNRSHR